MQKVKISKRVGRQLYRSSPTILTVVASVGVVTTTIMAVRATPKAIKILKEAELEKGEDLSKLEIIRAAGPIYIPCGVKRKSHCWLNPSNSNRLFSEFS